MSHKNLLIEIGTEELPPKALKSLSDAFTSEIVGGLKNALLPFEEIRSFATPRRLAVFVSALAEAQEDKLVERFGPAVKAAFDAEGNPTPAALGFAKSCGVNATDLGTAEKDGVEKLVYKTQQLGKPLSDLLEGIVNTALARLPIPKRMRWGSSRVEFVRPVHWVVLLFGNELVQAKILGKEAGVTSYGHRFHHPDAIELSDAADYEQNLLSPGFVIADFHIRKEKIREQITEQATILRANVVIDEALLDEVTSLVEWPVALTGSFDTDFLSIPAEALISSLKSHQKCFYLTDDENNLLPNFITVSNLASKDPAQVISGNEKVIRPRLADADFFYQNDKKHSLESRVERLKSIVFQKELGSVYDKSQRVSTLCGFIASKLGVDQANCKRAALLSKCDLITDMVGEFADLQGVMGKYYAIHDGENAEVAAALDEQYKPRQAGDSLPETPTGSVLALAEKLDTIIGLFSIGQPPTGSKDPFALRRAAIGVLRILVENQLDLDLKQCIDAALDNYSDLSSENDVADQVFEFFLDRFRFWYQEKNVPIEVFQAVLALKPSSPIDFDARINAVDHFSKLPEASALSSANKRVANILAKAKLNPEELSLDLTLLTDEAEVDLARQLSDKELEVAPLFKNRQYQEGLEALAPMKETIDVFFDKVLVMSDDIAQRNNRIALLVRLRSLFLHVADISYLHKN